MNHKKILKQLKKQPRVHGYIPPYTETKLSQIHGLGLFAKRDIKKGTVVVAWGGRVITKKEISSLPKEISDHYALELHPGFYLAETKLSDLDSSDFVNHSCNPNCLIIKRFIMKAKKNIKKGEELTADFSSQRCSGKKLICRCGAQNCKKVVYFD